MLKKLLLKRHKALRKAVINIITEAIFGPISVDDAADDIIKLVNDANKKVIEDYIWCARTVYRLDDDVVSTSNTHANYVVNVDAATHSKDKSDRRVFRKDANGRMIELRGVNTDAPDELY